MGVQRMRNTSLMSTLIAFALTVSGMAWGQESKYYESFEDGVPEYYSASRPGTLSVSPWHYKHGSASLQWDWRKGEELVIRRGIGDVGRRGGFLNRASFTLWVYMKEPLSDALVFEFREGETVTGAFRFPLKFTGWQQGRLHYHNFPDGRPTTAVDNIRILAPETVTQGTVFLDFIKYNTLSYPSAYIIPEKVAERRLPAPDEQLFPRPERVTEAELEGIATLGGVPPDDRPGVAQARVDELCERVETLGIVRDEHGIRGPGLDHQSYYCASPGQYGGKDVRYWPDELGPDAPEIQDPGPVRSLANTVAGAYRASEHDQQRQRLVEAFLLLADHLQDQGHSLDMQAVFLMRDVLAQEGLLKPHRDALLYSTRAAGAFFVEGDAPVYSNMDFYAYHVRPLLRLCFIQDDAAEQVRWLNAFKAMLERSILQPRSSLKIDGSAYHHGGHYHSYAQNAFAHLPRLLQDLRDTPWRISAEAHERLRRAMLAQRLYSNVLFLPLSLTGRSPFAPPYGFIREHGLRGMDALARLGTPDGTQEVDREVAAAYLRLLPEAADQEPYRTLGIEPEPPPEGTFVMPYAALLCHRRDNWLATIKGQYRYVWGSERQARRNAYGLFMGIGHLEIIAGGDPANPEASGRDPVGSGWDWARFEGTTVPQLPLDRIDKGWSSISARVGSPETFAGGLSHRSRQGVYGMILNQTIRPDTTLTGRKSWFFNDNQIICLGSDISCDEAQYPTQTTVCQKWLFADEQEQLPPTLIDGAQFTAFSEERTLDQTTPHWFIDVQQTGYYLSAGQNVTVARQSQTSRDVNDWEDTEGDFLTAWIDHGTAPEGASYEYMLVVRAIPEAMQRFAAQPPYQVIQRDQNAHIVWHTEANRWGCVLFVPQQVAAHAVGTETIPVEAVDRPCLIMADTMADGQLHLSVADPDLGQSEPLRVTLRGAWRLLEAKGALCAWDLPQAPDEVSIVSSDAQATVLEITCRHGASYDISLARQ